MIILQESRHYQANIMQNETEENRLCCQTLSVAFRSVIDLKQPIAIKAIDATATRVQLLSTNMTISWNATTCT